MQVYEGQKCRLQGTMVPFTPFLPLLTCSPDVAAVALSSMYCTDVSKNVPNRRKNANPAKKLIENINKCV